MAQWNSPEEENCFSHGGWKQKKRKETLRTKIHSPQSHPSIIRPARPLVLTGDAATALSIDESTDESALE